MNNIKFSKSIVKWFLKLGYEVIGSDDECLKYIKYKYKKKNGFDDGSFFVLCYKDTSNEVPAEIITNVSTEEFFKLYGGKYIYYCQYHRIPKDMVELSIDLLS